MSHAPTAHDIVVDSAVDATPPPAPEGLQSPQALTPRAQPSGAPDPDFALFCGLMRDGVPPEQLKQAKDFYNEREAAKRKAEFLTALARAKAEFTPIIKTRDVDYEHKDRQGRTKYKYEELADITNVVMPILAKHGITHSFEVDQSDRPKIKVRCILAHANGYQVEGKWMEGVDDTSGQKNPNQAIQSTITYWERSALKAALGLAAGRDDDGRGGGADDPQITTDDKIYVQQLVGQTNSDLPKLLRHVGALTIDDMRLSQFKRAIDLLEEKKRRAKSKPPETAP